MAKEAAKMEAKASGKGKVWKPFPWNWLPDQVAFIWGAAEITFIAPLMAVLIAIVVMWFNACVYILKHPRSAKMKVILPEMVRSVSRPLSKIFLADPRNHSYLPWMALLSTLIPFCFFWAMKRYATHGFEFSTLVLYHVIRLGPRFKFFGHAHTLAHKEGHSHTGIFRKPFTPLNYLCEWWICPFYGIVPNSYSVSHMKIHHRWHNDVDDVHTNLDLDRTKLSSFFIYVPRFTLYWTGLSAFALFVKRKEWQLLKELSAGMLAYYSVTALIFWWNPVFCLTFWIFAHAEGCVFLCAISYLWHAFVEESDPGNQYVNSVTIIEGHDNIFNEDYHVVHHHSPSTHWTDAPAHFEKHKDKYAAVTATIFRDTEEGMLLQMLFENDWDKMAKHFVDLSGKLSHADKKALLVRRLSYVVGETGRDGKRKEWGSTDTIRDFND